MTAHGARSTSAAGDPFGEPTTGVLQSGRISVDDGVQDLKLQPGKPFLHRIDVPERSEVRDFEVAAIAVPVARVAAVAAERTGLDAALTQFTTMTPVNAQMGRHYRDVTAFVHRQLLQSDADTLPALIVEQLVTLAAAAMLATFPNTTMTAVHLPGAGRSTTQLIRRAMTYIDEHADQPLT